jgi:hypothetical protein
MKSDLQPALDLLDKFPEFDKDLAERIVEHLESSGPTTFAELQMLSDLCVENEDLGYEWCVGLSNVVIWTHLTLKGLCTLVHLRRTGVIELDPCPILYYMMDGLVLTYPEVKRPPSCGYKKPHWVPTVVHLKK